MSSASSSAMSAARMCAGSTAWLEAAEAMENADCRASCALIVSVFMFICRFFVIAFFRFLFTANNLPIVAAVILSCVADGRSAAEPGRRMGTAGRIGTRFVRPVRRRRTGCGCVSVLAVKRRAGRPSAFPLFVVCRRGFVIRLSGCAGVRPSLRSPWRRAGGYEGSSCSWKGFQTSHRS